MDEPSFPRLYSAHVAQFTEDLALWRNLATSYGSPILELGCGPGRVVFDLAKKGFNVTGLDDDRGMIRWARAQIDADLQQKVNFIHADMRNFSLDGHYNLVIVPCNTFAYFNHSDARKVITCVKKHLKSHGKLALVIPNPELAYDYRNRVSEEERGKSEPIHDFIEPTSQNPVQVYAYEVLHGESNTLEVIWFFDELLPDGKVNRVQHDIIYHLRSLDETRNLLKSVALDIVNVYGDYQRGPYKATSDEIILLLENITGA